MSEDGRHDPEKKSKHDKHKESSGGTISQKFMRTMRMSSGKKRPAIHLEAAFDQTASSQNEFHQPGVSHDRTFTSDSRSMGSADGAASNEIDFHKLSDEEVRERFRAMMDDIIEGKEAKTKMFERTPTPHMREMLTSHYKLATNEMSGAKAPEYQIQCLNGITVDNVNSTATKETLNRVAFSLKKYGLKWSKAFGENYNGPNAMIRAMGACIMKIQYTQEKISRDGDERREKQNNLYDIIGAGIEAFKNYLNLGWNFNSLKESLAKDVAEVTIDVLIMLSTETDERSTKIKHICAIILFALAMPNENNPSNGQNILQLLQKSAQKWSPGRERFQCLTQGLGGSIDMASSFLMCINAIFVTLTIEQRYHARSELFRSDFKLHFEELQKKVVDCEDPKQKENLSSQIDLFLRHIDDDYHSMNIKLESIPTAWADLPACFGYLHNLVKNTTAESVLASIINRMICIRDDPAIRHSYLRLIDECITRIVFSKTASDPDFDTYSMDCESISDSALGLHEHTPSIRTGSIQDLSQMPTQMGNHVAAAENEIHISLIKGRIEHLEQTREKLTKALETMITKVDDDTASNIKGQFADIFRGSPSGSGTPPPPPLPGSTGGMPPPPAPPMPGSMGNIPPPPPLPGSMMPPPPFPGNIPPPPPLMPGLVSAAPPMMSEGGGPPPPPPPPPFMGGPGTGGPPPPPPFPEMRPGGGPTPPPPMGMSLAPLGLPPLPDYLPTKQKYVVGEPVKKVTWNKINPQTIKKESLWASIDEKRCQNKDFFASIKENFATKAAPTKQAAADSDTESTSTTTSTKKTKEFRILDARAGQNFAIMFSQLKCTPQQFRQWLLACDSVHLTGDLLAQLDKSLPTLEELKKLADLKNEINDLPDSEQYFCAISDIKRIHQRIKILLFKTQYNELLEDTEKNFIAGQQACDAVRRSQRFSKLVEMILTIGNYMNSSSKAYEPIYGFDMSFLPKLHSTKANDGKRTLLHFIVQEIEKDHPDLLKFGDEFQGVAEVASKIDTNELQRTLNEIKGRVNSAQTDLDNAKDPAIGSTPGDGFVNAMEGFVQVARDDIELLEALSEKMASAYQGLCDYVAIDAKKCPLNEFFGDLKSFCTIFLSCLQENRLWREQDEKAKRAAMSKQRIGELHKKNRAEAKPERSAYFKPNDDDTDVVSNLMSVLRDANVTSRPRRVRRC